MSDEVMNALIRAAARSQQQRARARLLESLVLPTRVFISFDFDQMRFEAIALGEQLRRSSRFEIQNWSMKEAAPQRLWHVEARRRLNRSDVMVIVVNGSTYRASGVLTEVEIATDLGVPIRQVYASRTLRPARAPAPAAPLQRWTHDNLATLLRVPRRRAG